ncbi:hypothetical protein O5D80_008143 [Batrachochytrium dendrobatidis]|nr:hypothetical protein O5D80_008143 [Batrachochytrium dendrobatidis]
MAAATVATQSHLIIQQQQHHLIRPIQYTTTVTPLKVTFTTTSSMPANVSSTTTHLDAVSLTHQQSGNLLKSQSNKPSKNHRSSDGNILNSRSNSKRSGKATPKENPKCNVTDKGNDPSKLSKQLKQQDHDNPNQRSKKQSYTPKPSHGASPSAARGPKREPKQTPATHERPSTSKQPNAPAGNLCESTDGNTNSNDSTSPTSNDSSPATTPKTSRKKKQLPCLAVPVSTVVHAAPQSAQSLRKPQSHQALSLKVSVQPTGSTRTRRLSVPLVSATDTLTNSRYATTASATSSGVDSTLRGDSPYAGATFQNSPAASALPIPMFSRSIDRDASPWTTGKAHLNHTATTPTAGANMYLHHDRSGSSVTSISDSHQQQYHNDQYPILYSPSQNAISRRPPASSLSLQSSDLEPMFACEDGGIDSHEDLRNKSRNLLAMLSAADQSGYAEDRSQGVILRQTRPLMPAGMIATSPFHLQSSQQHPYGQPYIHLQTSQDAFAFSMASSVDSPAAMPSPVYQPNPNHQFDQFQQTQHRPLMPPYGNLQPHMFIPVSLSTAPILHNRPELADLSQHLKHVLGLGSQ